MNHGTQTRCVLKGAWKQWLFMNLSVNQSNSKKSSGRISSRKQIVDWLGFWLERVSTEHFPTWWFVIMQGREWTKRLNKTKAWSIYLLDLIYMLVGFGWGLHIVGNPKQHIRMALNLNSTTSTNNHAFLCSPNSWDKRDQDSKGNLILPTIHFQVRKCC